MPPSSQHAFQVLPRMDVWQSILDRFAPQARCRQEKPLWIEFDESKRRVRSPEAIRAVAPNSFVVNAGIATTQTLINVLFNKIPQLSYIPTEKKTTHSSASSGGELRTQKAKNRAAYLEKFQGSLIIRRPSNSFFEDEKQLLFKKLVQLEASAPEPNLYIGYPSTDFRHIGARCEAEAALSVHTNIIAPVVVVAQKWVIRGYRLIISLQTYDRVEEIAENIGGFLDHGIFLVKDSCTSLRKDTDFKIVNTKPINDNEWMAVVIVEEKDFGTIQAKTWNQEDWAATAAKQHAESGVAEIQAEQIGPIVEGSLPQLRKYGHIFKCDHFMLTDYCTSIAVSFSHKEVVESSGMPIEIRDCGSGMEKWNEHSSSIEGDVFGYGPKASLAYLIFDSLRSRGVAWSPLLPELNRPNTRASARSTSASTSAIPRHTSTSARSHDASTSVRSPAASAQISQAPSSSRQSANHHQQNDSVPQPQRRQTRSTPTNRRTTSRH